MRSRDRREALKRALRWNPLWTLAVVFLIGGGGFCRPQIGLNAAGAVCVESAALCLLYGLIVFALKITHSWPDFREEKVSLTQVCAFVLISGFTTFFVLRKVINDHTVYYWDYVNYWNKTIDQSSAYLRDPFVALSDMYNSILNDDYNSFICLFMALPLQVLGNSFSSFVLIIQIMFNLPALWIISTAGKNMLARANISVPWLVCYLIASLCPAIFFPSAYAYPDSLALIFVAILLLLAIDFDWRHPDAAHTAAIGILLPFCLIVRRYFSFFIINYVIMLAICGLASMMNAERKMRRKLAIRSLVAYAIIGFISLGILIVFFNPLLSRSLNNNFKIAYSAYNGGTLLDKFRVIRDRNGGIVILFALLGAICAIAHRRTRGLGCGILAGSVASCLCFFQIQSMGYQHLLILVFPFALFMITAVGMLLDALNNWRFRWIAIAICMALLASNTIIAWTDIPVAKPLQGLFIKNRVISMQRNDIDELHEMAAYLNKLEGHCYLAASSHYLNSNVLKFLNYPYVSDAVKNLYGTNDVDLRDGFPTAFFDSEIVIVADPPQFHLGAENQRVIGALAQHFIDDTGFAVHYERLESFRLDGGITATVYRRFEDWTREDYDALRAEFESYYPDYPELFADRIHAPDVEGESEPST